MSRPTEIPAELPAAVRQMRWGLLLIGLHFIFPAISYIVDPATTVATVQKVNALLGGARRGAKRATSGRCSPWAT